MTVFMPWQLASPEWITRVAEGGGEKKEREREKPTASSVLISDVTHNGIILFMRSKSLSAA